MLNGYCLIYCPKQPHHQFQIQLKLQLIDGFAPYFGVGCLAKCHTLQIVNHQLHFNSIPAYLGLENKQARLERPGEGDHKCGLLNRLYDDRILPTDVVVANIPEV